MVHRFVLDTNFCQEVHANANVVVCNHRFVGRSGTVVHARHIDPRASYVLDEEHCVHRLACRVDRIFLGARYSYKPRLASSSLWLGYVR